MARSRPTLLTVVLLMAVALGGAVLGMRPAAAGARGSRHRAVAHGQRAVSRGHRAVAHGHRAAAHGHRAVAKDARPADALLPAGSGLSVQGNQLIADGTTFVARGVQIVGLVAPQHALYGKYIPAEQHFGLAELQAAVADHANLIRLQVSEFGLDPDSSLYSPTYVQQVQNAVKMARSLGLYVIISLQAERPAGARTRCPLPDAGAATAWSELAAMFGSDPGVMFELYNEPSVPATATGWAQWLDGGPVGPEFASEVSCDAVGMQPLIDDIRADGAPNVIVVPGAATEETLAGIPALTDPSNPADPQLVYGVHYPNLSAGISNWDEAFGLLSARVPVIVTEWDAAAITSGCNASTPAEAQELLAYLASRRIGLVGFSFDLPGTIVSNYDYDPTTYSSFQCGVSGGGPGQVLFADYAAEAQAGGAGTTTPTAWMVTAGAAQRLLALAPTNAPLLFDTPYTFVTGSSSADLAQLGLTAAIPTETFTNEASLAQAVNDDLLRPGTEAVVYAPTNPLTPRNQLLSPGEFFRLAALIAHQHGLLLIADPALSVAKADAPHLQSPKLTSKFLRRRIAATAARYADVYEIQAQSLQRTPSAFSAFVRQAAAQATSAHPSVEILSEIRAGAGSTTASAPLLLADLTQAGPAVSGYFLDAPGGAATSADATGDVAASLINGFVSQGG